jgi:GNAT superfamily N-acetyltransferase
MPPARSKSHSVAPEYCIERLDPAKHRRDQFHCESRELTEFIQKRAYREMEARTSVCFVLVPLADSGRIAGFYTLSAAEISAHHLPGHLARRLPRYGQMPATLLGRLARDEAFRGQGMGDRLMEDALARALAGSAEVGSIGVITDPKNDWAARFYGEFGFHQLTGGRLFLPMAEIVRLLQMGQA